MPMPRTGKKPALTPLTPHGDPCGDSPVTEAIRLNKALADSGLCSRRKADEHIFAGDVTINGKTADSPALRVVPGRDELRFRGEIVPWREDRAEKGRMWKPCWLMLHKPAEVVSTLRDPQGRPTVLDLVPQQWRGRRLYPVGRLDYFSEGLMLMTDDGESAHRLMHPRWHLPRVYEVRVRPGKEMSGGDLDRALDAMRGGMPLAEGDSLAPVQAETLRDKGQGVLLRLVLHQGVNRQIRRMCRDLGLTILKLKRVAQGPLQLGDLPSGKARALSDAEYAALRRALRLDPCSVHDAHSILLP